MQDCVWSLSKHLGVLISLNHPFKIVKPSTLVCSVLPLLGLISVVGGFLVFLTRTRRCGGVSVCFMGGPSDGKMTSFDTAPSQGDATVHKRIQREVRGVAPRIGGYCLLAVASYDIGSP